MDAELQELQRLFEQAQEAKPSVRLSDRNVVELVSKLQELHLLDADLLHTVSGKEYITQERLKEEIEGEVCRLGRVSLVDLAATLGVELIHCERQAQQIVGNNPDLSLVQGEILAATYWDSVAEEINETLQEAGQISVGELARQFNVGAELLTGVLGSRLGTLIQGKLEGGQLYTPTFVARIRAMVRGAVRALIIPTPLSTLWMSLQNQLREGDDGGGVGGVTGDGGLFQTILNQLIADGEVTGSLRGGNAMWTPAVFVVAQRESVEAFFSQNGYITYDALRKLTVPQPKQYLQAKYVDGIALETVFVHSSIVSQLDAAAEEAIATNTWFDALPLLPPSFGISDVAKLVSLCPSVQRALKEGVAVILAETCMLSNTLIRSIIEKFENQARELAQKKSVIIGNVTKDAEDHSGTPPVGTELDADDGGDTTQGKNARRKKGSHGVGANKPMLETDLVSGKGGKGKKRGPKNKHAISGLAGELGISAPKSTKTSLSSKGGIAASEDDDIFSNEDLAAKILEWYPDMDTAGTDEGDKGILVRTLAETLRPIVVSAWLDAKHAIFSAQAEERRRRVDSLQLKIDEVYANFQLFAKALDLFLGEKSTEVILHRHLLRTTGAEIADLFLTAQAMEQKLEEGGDAETAQDSSESLSTSQRLCLAKSLPGQNLSTKAVEMVESLEGKSVDAFNNALEAVVKESGLRLKKMDKKAERALLFAYRKGLVSQVEDETDPVALLPKVVALLFVQVHSRALQAPGRAMAAAVTRLKGAVPEESFTTLVEYHSMTVQLLSLQAAANPEEEECTSDRALTKREVLESRMPKLKALVLSSSPAAAISFDNEKQ